MPINLNTGANLIKSNKASTLAAIYDTIIFDKNSVIVLLVPEGLVVEGVDAQDVQVAQKPRRDFAPAAARRTHCRQEEDVKKFQLCRVLLVVPVAVVDPLETIEIG